MPLKVAFWNINTGEGSYKDRLKAFENWCGNAAPDLLILEEVSHTLEDRIETLTGMKGVVSVETLTKKRKRSTKQLWGLQKSGLDFKGKALRLPSLTAIRMCVKVTSSTYGFSVWGIHANASRRGGRTAVAYADAYLKKNVKNLIGGDLNCALSYTQNNLSHSDVTPPKSWQNNTLLFSQWKSSFGSTVTIPDTSLHLQNKDCGFTVPTPNPNGVIDYVISGNSRTVTALPNCVSEDEWVAILKNFDHCPVLYSVT